MAAARPPYKTHFFNGSSSAAHWLADNHAETCRASASHILSAIESLRRHR